MVIPDWNACFDGFFTLFIRLSIICLLDCLVDFILEYDKYLEVFEEC